MSNQEKLELKINAFFTEWKAVIIIVLIVGIIRIFLDVYLTEIYYKKRYEVVEEFNNPNKVVICTTFDDNFKPLRKEYRSDKYEFFFIVMDIYLISKKRDFEMIEIGNCQVK